MDLFTSKEHPEVPEIYAKFSIRPNIQTLWNYEQTWRSSVRVVGGGWWKNWGSDGSNLMKWFE